MYKSKRQKNKSFDWYGLSQRFSIRKYHFGAASVLLGTALILGAAQSTAKAEEATADNKTEAVTSTPKDGEGATSPTNVTLPATEATTGAPVLDKKELSEEEIAKLAAEASKKDDKTSETATTEKTEVADKEKATLVADSTDKKSEKAVDDKADKKDEKKAENPIAATKTILEQLTSEAEVLNTTAANYAEKKVEDKSSKEAIAAAVAAAKVEIAASKKVLNEKDVTAEQLNLQLQRISSAIEAVYTEMKRAGHIGKVEAVLDEANTANAGGRDSAPLELTPVTNTESLTDSEIAAIIKQIRTSNPGLTNEDTITVNKTRGVQGAGFTTITYADGSGSVTFEPGQVMVASAGIKNLEQLSSSINWFNFASATITYKDGTVATPVRYYENTTTTPNGKLYKQLDANTGSTGRTFEGYFSMYRDITLGRDYTVDGVLYAKGTKLKSTDDAFLKMGIAKYEQHIYYGGNLQGQTDVKVPNTANPTTYTTKTLGEIYEVLQVGMKFDVPTRVEGYRLSATVSKLAPKEVETDPQKGQGNRLRNYTSGTNGNSKAYGPTSVYDIVDGSNGGGRGVDVLLTTQDKTNSYLRSAGIHTNYRERREGDSDTNPTGPVREGLVAFSSSRDHANFGVSLYLEATYNGQLVPVNAVVADADESGRREYSQFETDGGAFEKLMEIHWDNRRLDSKGDAIVDGNGTSVLVDKHGNPYVDAAGNPMFINNKQTPTREYVEDNGITEAKYYLTTASGAKVLVSEKDHMPVLDADGNPTILDSTGTRMTTTREGLFTSTETERNSVKIKTREILDGEGRPILQGSAAMKGLEAFILPSGVKTFEVEYINGNKGKRKYYDTTDGKHKEITKDFYGRSIMYGSEVDGRLAKEGDDPRATLKFKNPDKRPVQLTNAGDLGDMKDAGYDPTQWVSPSAYGSKTFGSFWDAREDGYRLPIGLTQGVSNLSFYGNSTSSVSGVVGFIVTDGGDAPSSYGSAKHVIGNFNKVINNQEVTATQPYLGDQPGDPDFRSTVNEKSGDWVLDDLVMTNKYVEKDLGAGETDPSKQVQVTNQKGETGTFLITSSGNAVIRKEDGTQVAVNQGDVLTTPDPKTGLPMIGIYNSTTKKLGVGAIPDEGEAQLLDPDAVDNTGKKIKGEYTLRQASDTEYVLYGVKANPGVNNKEAYLRGWVDFNGNGKFDVDEASELIKVTPGQKTYDVKFKNIAQLLDTSIDKAGVRLRIALEEQDIRESTGLAGSGEVEDFQTFVTHSPRGTRHETKDYQGQEQNIKIPTNAMFIANGKSKDSGYKNWAQINNVELSPKIVLTDKIVDTTKVTTLDPNAEKDKTDLGTKGLVSRLRKNPDGSIYTKDGNVFIDKNDATVLSGKLVQVKDKNNKVLGTALEVVNPNNNKTEYLMSEYNEYDNAGNKVGTYKINPANAGDNKELTGGFYETAVTFKPEIGFVGKAKGIAIRAWDDNNNSTGWEASTQTIAASAASTTLADKDKINGNVNNGVNNYKSMDTTYIPTVIDIKPVGKDETTIDEQGKKQSATPRIPDHGTVESINNEHIDEAKIDKAHVLIDKSKPIKFATTESISAKTYTEDTKVTEETVVTYEDGGTATFKPVDKIPAGAVVFDKNQPYTVTGTGNITVNKVNYGGGSVPKGAILTGSEPTAPVPVTVLRDGNEVIVQAGEKLKKGDQLVTPLPVHSGAQRTEWTITYQKGETIPGKRTTTNITLENEITVDQLLGKKGDSITFDGKTYTNNNDTIPKGTKTRGTEKDLLTKKLPKATHVNPTTGEVTTVERRYTKVTDTEIVIENEGTYTLVPKTKTNEKGETVYEDAEIVFTPHPSFVGVGTGVTIKQPDVDYDNPVATDSVRSRYGTDYGYAKYTPTVTPNLTATITRKIHYVYEGDASVPPQDKTPILTIDGKPVTNEQTLTYNRDYIVMSQDGQTEKDITVATEMTLESPITVDRYVRKATGEVVKEATQVTQLKPGDVVKAGTQLPAGTVIVGAWKAINPENDHFTDIISPTLKGYTAEVQLPEGEYTKSEKNGVQSHVRSSNQTPVGVYTPTIKDGKVNTQDVGAYEPMVSAVRADNKDDFDVYVYYKADKQVARVVYIDMDAANNADQGVLETHTGSTLEANKSATDTITKDETLYGDSATRIKYSTAATIAKYEAMGYELKRDGFTNDDDGNRIVGGRKFDEESVADSVNAGEKAQNQTFYVFLGHKRDTGAKTERADVTRTINYKYKKDGSKAAESVTETLNFTRNITIDMALAAAAFPEDTATFNAENTKATPEEKQAAQAKYAEVEKQYNAAAEKVKEDSTTAQALATADKDVTTTEKALADAKKANNSLVITSESTQAQKDAKAVVEAALQAAQTAYDNALAARNTARTNYLAAANSDLAKAVITTQKALEAENAKVAAAKAEYEAKVKDNNASDADKNAALTKFTDAIALAKTAAVNATAAQKAFTDAKDEKEALNDAKVAEAVKNQAIQDRANTTQAAKEAARQAYYDAVIAKVKEESKKETPDKNKVAAVSFGEWKALGSSATNLPTNEQLSEAEKQSDNAFNHVTSPTITGYLADKVAIDKTDAIDPLADDYEVDVFYEQGEQRAIVKFVEVDANNPDTVITPGVAEDLVEIGKTGDNFATLNTAAVKAAIKKLEDKGYTLVSDGFENPGTGVSNTTFDNDPKKDQEFVVKVKAKVVDIPSFDPTKPVSNDNPKPTPGVIPIDPSNPSGPKWTEDLIKAVKVQEEVTRTIKYVYEDGTEVPADKLADVADKKVKTLKFTRPGKINVVTGEITYGDWSADQTFDAVTSPIIENYIAAVAGVTPTTANVPAKTVTATDKDFEEVVVYKKAKPVTITPDAKVPDPEDPNTPADNPIQPNKPIDPNNPEGPKWTKELIDKLRAAREETVTRTITYKYSTETSELKAEDAAKAGQTAADTVTNSVTFKRPVTIDPVTKEFTYGDWVADNNDTTLEGKADLPVVAGYVATGDVEASKKDVTDVKATDKDITDKVVYKALGKFVPVVPEGFTPPTIENPQYPNNNDDPSKPGDPTTTTTIPYVPGTTPVGPDGQPLKPKVEGDPKQGYVPPAPTTPTGDTTIVYVKDGSQVAVVHFVDEKGNSVNESVIETGDTGGTISTTKADAVKTALEAKGYEVVAPTDALYTADKEGFYKEADRKFDAVSDKATGAAGEKVPSQQYYVIVKAKELPVVPTKPVNPNNEPVDPTDPTTPNKPRDPETTVTPKPTDPVPNDPKGRTYGELGLVEEVTRTINYVKNDGTKAAEPVKETLTFTRKAKINAVTGEVTYLAADGVTASTKEDAPWTPVNGDKFTEKVSPAVPNYTPTVEKVAEKTGVTATDEDIVETVVYNPTKQTVDPNAPKDPSTPDVTPKPNDVVPNDPKGRTYKELGLIEEVTRTVHYVYEDGTKAAEDKVQTITFTRTAEIDTVTGAISNFGTWTLKDENNTFEPETTEAKAGYVASAAKSTEVTGVQATDKDTEETIIYRKLGSYVPVVPAGVTPPADFDKTPKPYPNATPEDPTRPGTPTTPTTTIPEIPGTTPVGPDGTPLTKNPNGGYDLPPVPTDPTQNTTITYVKDGSQVAVVHFVDEKGNSVNESVVETGDTGKEISKSNVDAVKAKLEAKGYTVVEPTDALYTTDKEGFYKEATRTFDAVSDKSTGTAGEKVPSQQYYVIVKAKDLPVDPTKPLDPNNNPVDPTNPTPENPTKPRDPETPVTPKPEDKVPNDPKGRTYGELGLVEQVTRTINYVKNDGSKAADPVKETLTFTRKAKINAVTGEVTYLDNDGNATTKEAAPWTPVNNDTTFDKVTSPSVPDYTPTKAEVPAKENVTATDEDIVETVVYNPTKQTVDPNAPKDPSTPNVTPKPNDVVPNDPKGRTYKELGLIEEVTRTVHYVYEDGTKAAEDKVQTITFTRTAEIDTVTGAISNFGTWTLKDENNTFEPETTEAKAGYVASAAKSTEVTGVQATDKDTEETIIYRKLGSYVPVVPAGVTPPADFDKTPKPYPNATPEDPTRPGTPTTPTTTIPEIPGTTPVGPDGTPLTKNPNGGYDLPPVPTDPTQNTTITYVKDGSQVAVVHFVDEKGNSVNESVVETGDTGKEISKSNVDAVKAKLEAKGYTVVEPTDALYTTDKEGFYKEATRTFDAVSDKSTGTAGEKVPSQQYYVIVKAKDLPVDPTKPLDPNNNPVDPTNPTPENPTKPRDPETPVTPKPEDKVPNDPKGRTYGELGLVEQVTRTINYVKNDGSKAADPVKETLTFTRKAKINAVTGEVTYLDNDGNATTKEAAPWTPVNNDTTFDKVTSPSVPDYTPTKAEVPAKENVTATDEDIVETVVYNPAKVTVTPNDPNVDPEKPLNPNDPNGLKYKDLKLTEEVKRTITYTYADDVADTSKRGTDAAPKHETTVSFTRTATVNQATGEVTYGDWTAVNNDTTLEGKTELPVIPGYVATGDVESVKKDVANVSATDKDIVEKVVYKDLGKYVPVVPDGTTPPTITDPKYPNNPTDPTKPGEPTTTIPNVPGLTPLDPSTGKPLEPKDPNDLTKGYKPPVPQDPSKDTNIVYVADGSQVTVVHFVDEDGNAVHTSFVEAGDAGAKFTKAGEVTKVVEELKAAGYAVVPNKAGQAEYPGEAGVFDSVDDKGKDGVSQVYYVTVAKTVPVTPTNPENPNEDPKNPKPGDPIDPNKPDGPKWTEDALNKLNNIKSVTRTITYVKDGTDEEVSTTEAPKVTNKVSFTRTAIVNPKDGSVVGYDTNGDGKVDVPATDTTTGWTAAGTAKFAEVKSPVVKGYVVKPNQDTQGDLVEADGSKVKASTTDLTVDSPNQDLKVRYVPVGTWTPKVPDGETPIDPIPYPNDPKDPGKVVDPNKPTDPNDPNKPSVPVVPHIPGTTPKDPNGNPLKPVDPEDPSKGYVPPTPTTPTENTVIEYVKDDQKAVTKFVDPSGNPIPGVNNIEEKGKSGEPLTKATEVANEIAKLIAKGYELVSNNYGKDNNGNFDKDSGKDQEYTVVLTPHVEPIKPFDPTNPNDPNKPKPGTPIDPNNPDGPKWTEELIKSLETTKHVTRTISYVDKDGNKVEYTDKDGNKSTADVTDKVTFTREAKINLVTGAIEYGKWTPVNNDTTFDKVTSPVVPGYVLKDPAQKEVAETTGLTENSKDENIKVVYVPVGRLVPKVPNGVTPPTPTPYDNDPQDPGKVVPPSPTKPQDPQDPNSPKVPVIPHIPGTTPKVPQDPTKPVDPNTNPLVPLKPVDPKDPSKGYEVPPVPTNPGTDTPIVYENDKQKAITNFVDNNGKVVSDPVVDQGDSGSKFTKNGEVEDKIKELLKKGYIVTSNDYPSADTDRVFDNDKDKDQIFNVKVTPLIVPTDPNSPDKPQVPTDPTKPVGPNNPLKPVTPSNPEPGKPVFPEDPNSPVWPETVKDLVTESSATRTITYVDRNGKEVAATHTETIKFKRTAKVNLVTGDITYGEWTVVGDDTILNGNPLPSVKGYIARGGDIKESQEDIKAEAGKNITQTVVYAKLGSWIPRLPEGQTNVPPTPYPNDPTDPTKPGTDKPKVPYVPGFIPVDPNGNPLKPVDPNDPTKGYEVPDVPADPTQDTPIKYIPVPTPNNGGGNNGGGGGNTPTPQPQPNPTPQPEPSPAPNPVPVTPETPEQPVAPVTPEQPAEPATPQYMDGQRELPNTGTEAHSSLAALGLLGALSGFGLIARKKRKDEE